ncbi:MAG: transporter substrate-binding domain-containing protein [Alphaproteobacteria bacterium]|nr:MAG: transporter substrate-binding domain-containing protein [Alphaproteobacteria bacterium]TMJ41375.1 MAG: transporter substrate-binding domain-containing protein [Alphaproteobacteria bacterium]
MKSLTLKSLAALVALCFAIIATPQIASAEDDPSAVLNQIRSSGVLKIPVMTGEEPGYIKDKNTGAWSGFYVEFLTEIADALGVKIEPVETTWGNLAADFQSGKIDIAIGVNPNPKRGLVVDYLWEPLFTDAWAVLTPKGKPVKTWAELNDPAKKVVAQKGSTMQVVAEALLPKATITPVEDRNLALLELQAGRADAVVFSIFDALQITEQGLGDVSLPEPILRNPATLAVARKPGNAGYINFLTNWVLQQRSLGLAQGKLMRSWEARGINMSILPAGFSF